MVVGILEFLDTKTHFENATQGISQTCSESGRYVSHLVKSKEYKNGICCFSAKCTAVSADFMA